MYTLHTKFVLYNYRKPYVGFLLVMFHLISGDLERSDQRPLIFNALYLRKYACYTLSLYYTTTCIGNNMWHFCHVTFDLR